MDDLTFAPWMFADPTIVYIQSMAALEEMKHVGWDLIEQRKAGVFTGGPAAHAAYMDDQGSSDATLKIWMSPDCYPLRVQLEADGAALVVWELYDLGAEVSFDIPADMQS